jgi:hypothetical protein
MSQASAVGGATERDAVHRVAIYALVQRLLVDAERAGGGDAAAAADMKQALQTATADDASVVYWYNETEQTAPHLTWLKDKEDDAEAQAMYGRIKEKGVEVIKGESFESDGTTYYPMLVAKLVATDAINPAHLLLAHEATSATPYYFLERQRRDAVLAFVQAE